MGTKQGGPVQAQQLWPRPQVPHRVHPFGDVLVVLDTGGAPFYHQKGGLEEQGHDQRGEQGLHLRPPTRLQQELIDGSGGLGRTWGAWA